MQSNKEPFQVASRTETIIPISTTASGDSTFVIHSQFIVGKNMRFGTVLYTVKQGKLLVVLVNCTEHRVTLQPLQLKNISCDEFQ